MKKFSIGDGFTDLMEKLQASGKVFVFTAILMLIIMGIVAGIVFFASVKGQEQVMVPDVVGKDLTEALQDMQVKELYPKIQLRYSNNPDEKGQILEQNPPAGAIVKADRHVELVVSRGAVIDKVENYINQKYDDVKVHLQTLFTSTRTMILLQDPPLYVFNAAEAGTILEQNPPEGTIITDPVTLELVVSKGPEFDKTKVPALTGLSLNDTLLQMSRSKVVFDFTAREAASGEKPGVVVSQSPVEGSYVDVNSRGEAVITYPANQDRNMVFGIYKNLLSSYPYALQVQLDVLTPDGERYNLVTMNHPGGMLSVPYYLPRNSVLILSVGDSRDVQRTTVQ